MCGRYYFNLDAREENNYLKKLIEQYNIYNFEQGEIFPSQEVLALVLKDDKCIPKIKSWGITTSHAHVINARSETVHEKKLFQKMQRCVIPCNKFYEWKAQGKHKTKYQVKDAHEHLVYLAGLCTENELVILTKEANHDMKRIHHRSPILLHQKDIQYYLNNEINGNENDEDFNISPISESEQITFDL